MLPWFRMSEGKTTAAIQAAGRFAEKEAALDALIAAGPGGGSNSVRNANPLTLTDAQIKAGTIVPIVAATEVLNYSGIPTELPVPVFAWARLNNSAGGYDDVEANSGVYIVWGSDWSLLAAVSWDNHLSGATPNERATLGACRFQTGSESVFNSIRFNCLAADVPSNFNGAFNDNGLYLKVYNNSIPLTSGDPSNSLIVSMQYVIIDTATGQVVI